MNLQIELFTTPTVEGRRILSSKGLVCANVILAAGVISDAYKEKIALKDYLDSFETDGLESHHYELFQALENKAFAKNANAVVDLHIEHNYVHRESSYYLLISAQGTAVVLEGGNDISTNSNIDGKVLEQQIVRNRIQTKLNAWYEKYEEIVNATKGEKYCRFVPSADEWEFLCRYPDLSIAERLHFAYTEDAIYVSNDDEYYGTRSTRYNSDYCIWRNHYHRYFRKLPYEKQLELAYNCRRIRIDQTYWGWISSNLIVEFDLFDAKHILEWAQKGELEFATECLKARKKEYSSQDLKDMQSLYDFFV